MKSSMMVKKVLPQFLQRLIVRSKLHKIRYFLKNKYHNELDFQLELVKNFADRLDMVHKHWVNYRFLSEIISLCRITEETRILDVGCGLVSVLHFIDGVKFAVDPLANEYAKFDMFGDICLKAGFGEYLPFEDCSFDVVFCSNALDHTTDPVRVVAEMRRVMKEKAFLVVVVEVFDKKFKRDSGHPHTFTVASATKIVANFNIVFKRLSVWNPTPSTKMTDLIMVMKK